MIRMLILLCILSLTSCSFNPFSGNHHTTGSPAGAFIGAGVGAGGAALLTESKTLMLLSGAAGGAIGYYATTLRFESGNIIQHGGQVFKTGDVLTVDIPSEQLFEINTADFLPQAPGILDSVATVLHRFPNNNVRIVGNTAGFGSEKSEQSLSERRAQKIAAYLWDSGVTTWKDGSNQMRKLTYVGDGHYSPIANTYTNPSIRLNSHIQIVSFPENCAKEVDRNAPVFRNIGAMHPDRTRCGLKGEC